MSAATDLDPVLRYACKLLHSSHSDSAEKIRNALDEIIRLRHGAHRMLVNTLPKRHLADETLAPGSGIPPPPPPPPALAPPAPTTSAGTSSTSGSRRPSNRSLDSRASSLAKDSPVHITTITLDSGGEDNGNGSQLSGGSGAEADGSELVISVPDDDEEEEYMVMSQEDHMKVCLYL